ncbi:MAG: DUF4190 domain-containing protein [Mycobacterium sp.]
MTAPGGGFGESAHDDEANPPPAGGNASEQADGNAPWEPPAADYPPPAYPLPGYPPGYSAEYQAGQAAQYPPPIPPPPGYEQQPGYGAPPYQPGPPQFGGPPAGYGPPPYPGSYYPAPDYQGGYGPQGAMQSGTNGLAIASLISSFAGVFCCIGSIVAIVLGAIALDQIKRSRQDGYGLAVAGIVIGIATLVVTLIVTIFALHSR